MAIYWVGVVSYPRHPEVTPSPWHTGLPQANPKLPQAPNPNCTPLPYEPCFGKPVYICVSKYVYIYTYIYIYTLYVCIDTCIDV